MKFTAIISPREMILDHLYNELDKSMIGYLVNGNPVQRRFTLLNIANYTYMKMSESDREALLDTIMY